MNEKKEQVLYSSPKVEVIEIKSRQMICQSGYTNPSDSNPEELNW